MHNDIDRDLYEILGVNKTAGDNDIKNAYRKKARECHPDVAHDDPDGEHKFKELTFAYEILSDPQKRQDYDRWGLEGLRRGTGFDFNGFSTISDLFDAFFGGGFGGNFGGFTSTRARTQADVRKNGRDIETMVTIELKDVINGIEKDVELNRQATCVDCNGSGMAPGSEKKRCVVCAGSGQQQEAQRSLFGTVIRMKTCEECKGSGEKFTDPCSNCDGEGLSWVKEKVKVKIPPGVERGDRLRVPGKGEGGRYGGGTGDLYVVINIPPNRKFERDGQNIYAALSIEMEDAALGASVDMDSLSGKFKLEIPSGTQPGDILKAKGKGLPPRHGGKIGDMYIAISVSIPKKLRQNEKRLLQEYRDKRRKK